MSDFECALTGRMAEAVEADDRDGMKDLPAGWTKITISRRQVNPRWAMLMQVQNAMIEGALSQVPPELQEIQRIVISSQVEAQFHMLMKDTPTYVADVEDEVYISDSAEVTDTMNEIREMLGLKPLPVPDEEEDEDEPETPEKAE